MPFSTHWKRADRRLADTGWLPQHLVLEDAAGGIAACMPCYLKSHSYGEYVFDHAWADAYERAGGSYYPKLQASVPFTPVTGPRLLVREGPGRPEREALLLQAGATLTERLARLLAAHHLPDARGMGACRQARLPPAQRPAIPLAERELCGLRGFPRRARLTQAQGHSRRAQARDRGRHRDRMGDRRRPHRSPLGRVLRLLHGHWFAQMGHALSDAELFQPDRREHAR